MKEKYFVKPITILDFQLRLLDMVKRPETPEMEKLNFCGIIYTNLREFVSLRGLEQSTHYEEIVNKLVDLLDGLTANGFAYKDMILSLYGYNHSISDLDLSIYESKIKILDLDDIVKKPQKGIYYCNISTGKAALLGDDCLIKSIGCTLYDIGKSLIATENSTHGFIEIVENDKTNNGTLVNPLGALMYDNEYSNNEYSIMTSFGRKEIMSLGFKDCNYYLCLPREIFSLNTLVSSMEDNIRLEPKYFYDRSNSEYYKLDYLNLLKTRPLLLNTPYDSYQMVLDFIDQTCSSKDIDKVYISIYRLKDKDSAIINSLIKAAKSGKRVHVNFELNARGNEKSNKKYLDLLKKNNVIVSYGYCGFKVHAKCYAAVAKDGTIYSHLATGNYNESTSKFYTDFHYLTSEVSYGKLIIEVINLMAVKGEIPKKLSSSLASTFSPGIIRKKLEELIKLEAKKKNNGRIIIKCNNIFDTKMQDLLLAAANKGCKILIICRSICGIKSHKNITIISKIHKFLEHSRLYIFGDRIFISSADLLTRNLDRRVEGLIPIRDEKAMEKIIQSIRNDLSKDAYDTLFKLNGKNEWIPMKGIQEEYSWDI